MTGGTLDSLGSIPLQEMLGVAVGQWNLHPNRRHQRRLCRPQGQDYADLATLHLAAGWLRQRRLRGVRHERRLLGVNAIYVGANAYPAKPGRLNAGTGVFNQTGGSVGSYGSGSDQQCRWSGSGRRLDRQYRVGNATHTPTTSLGPTPSATRTARAAALRRRLRGRSALTAPALSPRIAEPTPSSAEGTMRHPGRQPLPYNTAWAPSCSAGIAAPNRTTIRSGKGLFRPRGGDVQPQRRALDRRCRWRLVPSGLEIVGVAGTGNFNQTGGTNIATSCTQCGRTRGSTCALYHHDAFGQPRLWNLHPQRRATARPALG